MRLTADAMPLTLYLKSGMLPRKGIEKYRYYKKFELRGHRRTLSRPPGRV